MTDDSRLLSLLADVLDAAPSTAPDRLLGSVLDHVQALPQRGRRPSAPHWRLPLPDARRSALASAGLVLGVVAVVALVQLVPGAVFGPAAGGPPSPAAVPTAPAWTATWSMITPRAGHTATLLPDGRVLVAGGASNTSELYDPRTGRWTAMGTMTHARTWHSATLLADGRVLVAGGMDAGGILLASAELYDPGTGTWTITGSLTEPFSGHTATRLTNGTVLVAGGFEKGNGFPGSRASAELYDPVTGTWAATHDMTHARSNHTATLLPDGRVLVAGGHSGTRLASAELYDPVSATWTAAADMTEPYLGHTATLLPNGTVLVAGGDVPRGGGAVGSAHAAVYDPVTATWTTTGSMITPRLAHTAALLPDGRVLVSGGRAYGGPSAELYPESELYNPRTGSWTATADMTQARAGHTATLLPDGRVLVAGGEDVGGNPLTYTELYVPGKGH
jgi:WD40 repeat protein